MSNMTRTSVDLGLKRLGRNAALAVVEFVEISGSAEIQIRQPGVTCGGAAHLHFLRFFWPRIKMPRHVFRVISLWQVRAMSGYYKIR